MTKCLKIASSIYNPEVLSLELERFFRRFYMRFCTKVCICSTNIVFFIALEQHTYLEYSYRIFKFFFFSHVLILYIFSRSNCFLFHIMLLIRDLNKFVFNCDHFGKSNAVKNEFVHITD